MNWRFENTGFQSGVFNMDYDIKLAQALIQGTGYPTLRLYGWMPSAISLGWNQSMDEIDQEAASASGLDVVRRPTGGRAILHSEELTYSVVMNVKEKNVLSVYEEISRALISGLSSLGIPAAMEKSQPHFPSLYRASSAAACFSSTGRYEIKCHGRKLVGSAQRRYAAGNGEEVVLQHGSVLLGPGHKEIVRYLVFRSQEERETLRHELDEKTTDLSAMLHRPVGFQEAADAVVHGFQTAWSIFPESVPMREKEEKAAV